MVVGNLAVEGRGHACPSHLCQSWALKIKREKETETEALSLELKLCFMSGMGYPAG